MREEPRYISKLLHVNARPWSLNGEPTIIQTHLAEYDDSSEEAQSHDNDAEDTKYD